MNSLDIEDYYGLLAISLVDAADRFNPNYGTQFSTFAYKIMKNAVLRDKIKSNRDALTHTISLDGFCDDGVALVEIIPNENKSAFDIKLPQSLTSQEKDLLIYRLSGFTNKDIYSLTGMLPAKIADTMRIIRYKYLQENEVKR